MRIRPILLLLLAFIAANCSSAYQAPTAVATVLSVTQGGQTKKTTSAANVPVGAIVQLDGSQSTDPAGLPLTYSWSFATLPTGSQAQILGPTTNQPSFKLDQLGDYVVQLIVNNGQLNSAPTTVLVSTDNTNNCGANSPVVASISGMPTKPEIGDTISLTAMVTDKDIDVCKLSGVTESYAWSLASQPPGSNAQILAKNTQTPSLIPDKQGEYTVQLVVSDNAGHQGSSTQKITVGECNVTAISATPMTPAVGQNVTLTGTIGDGKDKCSMAAMTNPSFFSWAWSLVSTPAGSHAALSEANTMTPSFTPDKVGAYVVQVVLTDQSGHTRPAVNTTVNTSMTCGTNPPVISAINAAPAAPQLLQPVNLSATITDADVSAPCNGPAETFSYAWSLVAPQGSKAFINVTNSSTPAFIPDVPGDYQISLQVTDNDVTPHTSMTVTKDLGTLNCGNNPPVFGNTPISASPANPNANQAVTLTASVTDPDDVAPCGGNLATDLSYLWTLLSSPVGSEAALTDKTGTSPTFIPDLEGKYLVQVAVTDSEKNTVVSAPFTLTTTNCGSAIPTAMLHEVGPNGGAAGTSVTGQTVLLNTTVQVSGADSTDADNLAPCNLNETLNYFWKFTQIPAGSTASLDKNTVVNPSFTIDVAGTYQLQLTVTDSTNLASNPPATFTINGDPLANVAVPNNFTIATVAAGPTSAFQQPRGVSEDTSGNIYVLNNGGNQPLRKIAAGTGVISTLVNLNGIGGVQDIVFAPNANGGGSPTPGLFVSGGNADLVVVSLGGVRSSCIVHGPSFQAVGLAMYTTGQSAANVTPTTLLLVGDPKLSAVDFIDPSKCSSGVLGSNTFTATINTPWGVTGAYFTIPMGLGPTDNLAEVDDSSLKVLGNSGGVYQSCALPPCKPPGTGTSVTLAINGSNGITIKSPRKAVNTGVVGSGNGSTNGCASPLVIFADHDTGNVYYVSNTNGLSNLATGLVNPVGLWLESTSSLLITDENQNLLARLSGNFCTLP